MEQRKGKKLFPFLWNNNKEIHNIKNKEIFQRK